MKLKTRHQTRKWKFLNNDLFNMKKYTSLSPRCCWPFVSFSQEAVKAYPSQLVGGDEESELQLMIHSARRAPDPDIKMSAIPIAEGVTAARKQRRGKPATMLFSTSS
jgi:hypothetical protein